MAQLSLMNGNEVMAEAVLRGNGAADFGQPTHPQ